MCRWNAYIGQPLLIGELLYRTKRGLIDESLHSRMGAETTNGDGFGVGWYGVADRTKPAGYRMLAQPGTTSTCGSSRITSSRRSSSHTSERR